MIGIDGCDFNILKPLIDNGVLPTFAQILKGGCHSPLISTLPFNTLPAWTSIFTGVNPGKHGITDNILKENGQFRVANNKYRMVETLWSILDKSGLKQIIVNEPVTYPPERINGIMLSGFSTPLRSRNFAHPPAILDEVNKVCNDYEPDLPFGFEKVIAANKEAGLELISAFAEKTFKAAKHLAENYSWDILSVIFTSSDRLQHFYFHKPKHIHEHYHLLDKFIREIINIENEANIIVVSDHGFGALNSFFFVNTWLKHQGLVSEKQDILNSSFSRLGLTNTKLVSALRKVRLHRLASRAIPMSFKRSIPSNSRDNVLEIRKSLIFSLTSPNGGLFVNRSSFGDEQLSSLADKLSSLKENGEEIIGRVYFRRDVLWGPYAYRAADIFLIPKYGYEVSHRLAPSCLSNSCARGIRTGTHRPLGIFLCCGPHIRKGTKLNEPLFTWDIVPTVLHMLNLPIPSYMDGHVEEGMFEEGSEPATRSIKRKSITEQERIALRIKMLREKSEDGFV